MSKYSQGKEEEIILEYFKDEIGGTILSIGENNGSDLSNCLALIEQGFCATLVEPSPMAFRQLVELHKDRDNVYCTNVAVSDFNGKAKFYNSGTHLQKGDTSLLSSLNNEETKKWRKTTEFNEIEVDVVDFKTLLNLSPHKTFDFISTDAEGCDLLILKQMNLKGLKCKLLCIEHNSKPEILKEIRTICATFGLVNELLINAENIILSRK